MNACRGNQNRYIARTAQQRPTACEDGGFSVANGAIRPADGALYGAETVSWDVNRRWFPLIGGPRAAILQVCDPAVAAGVANYSAFRTNPIGRLDHTLDAMLTISFASPERRDAMLKQLRRIHAGIRGTTADGSRYTGNDPDLQYWVLATLIDTTFEVERRYVGEMRRPDRERFFRESKSMASAFGVPDELIPDDLEAFRAYMDDKFATLVPTEESREITSVLMRPGLRFVPDQSFIPLNWITAELLPSRLRRLLDVPKLNPAELQAVRTARMVSRTTLPRLHGVLASNPWSNRVLRPAA